MKWLYHLGDISPARAAEIAAHDAGIVVVDAGIPVHSREFVDSLRGTNGKKILAYLSIGEAEPYRDYWRPIWNRKPPVWLAKPNPEWPDNFNVKYWNPQWQEIILDCVADIMAADFDGLYLDIVDAWQYWEDREPGPNYKARMASFVQRIRGAAGPEAMILGQNGEELIANKVYRTAVSGIAKEDFRFYYPNGSEKSCKPVPNGWHEGSKEAFATAQKAGKIVLVVEYLTPKRQNQYAAMLNAERDWLSERDIPLYVAHERDLVDIYG